MTQAERSSLRADRLISESEALRLRLTREVERLETFVVALQAAVELREARRHGTDEAASG